MSEESRKNELRSRRPTQHGETRPNPATVLVVDDDPGIRNLLQDALHLHGYEVLAAGSVTEANEVLEQFKPGTLALVITDIHLTTDPTGLEGYELYQIWSNTDPTLRFLLMSGDPETRSLPHVQSGAVSFLRKPFTLSHLVHTVDALIAE